jgi:hypothetical protein
VAPAGGEGKPGPKTFKATGPPKTGVKFTITKQPKKK